MVQPIPEDNDETGDDEMDYATLRFQFQQNAKHTLNAVATSSSSSQTSPSHSKLKKKK